MDSSCGIQGRGYPDVSRRAPRFGVSGTAQTMVQRPRVVRHLPNLEYPGWQGAAVLSFMFNVACTLAARLSKDIGTGLSWCPEGILLRLHWCSESN
jgi:hypothetical protein